MTNQPTSRQETENAQDIQKTHPINWRHGKILCFNDSDLISNSLAKYGEWAQIEINFIKNYLLLDNDFFLDIGAYIGTHAISFAKELPNATGIAIEPNADSIELLQQNIKISGSRNLKALKAVMDSADGKYMRLTTDDSNKGHTVAEERPPGETGSIHSRTIDSLQLQRLNFIKIDVEGMERNVLEGGEKTISKFSPNIFIEFASLDDHAFLLNYSRRMHYKIYGFFSNAYNARNYLGNTSSNIFGGSRELGIVLTRKSLKNESYTRETGWGLLEIESLDDMAHLLTLKPQYIHDNDTKWESVSRDATLSYDFSVINNRDEAEQAKAEAIAARNEAEQAKAEAIAARNEAEQAKAEASRHENLARKIYNSNTWKATYLIRVSLNKIKQLLRMTISE